MSAPTKTTLHDVRTRDGDACALCGRAIIGERGREWSLHHRRPRSMGGTRLGWVNQPENLVLLHGSGVTACHGWVESHRHVATDLGFLVSANGIAIASEVPIRHKVHGWCLLTGAGVEGLSEVEVAELRAMAGTLPRLGVRR